MSQTRKKPAQMELFAGQGEIHELGLLGWEDALWTKRFEVPLLSGDHLTLDLVTVRRLHKCEYPSPAPASSAESKQNR